MKIKCLSCDNILRIDKEGKLSWRSSDQSHIRKRKIEFLEKEIEIKRIQIKHLREHGKN